MQLYYGQIGFIVLVRMTMDVLLKEDFLDDLAFLRASAATSTKTAAD